MYEEGYEIMRWLIVMILVVMAWPATAQESGLCTGFSRLAPPSWSKANQLIAFGGDCEGQIGLFIFDPEKGSLKRLPTGDLFVDTPSWSRAGDRIAFSVMRETSLFDLYVIDVETVEITQLTSDGQNGGYASWTPDDKWLGMYRRDASEKFNLYRINSADGWERVKLNVDSPVNLFNIEWSPDGSSYLYSAGGTIYVADSDSDERQRVTPKGVGGFMPRWSRDGTFMVFDGYEGETWQLYRLNLDGSGLKQLTASPRGTNAALSPQGGEIVYECELEEAVSLCILDLETLEFRILFRP